MNLRLSLLADDVNHVEESKQKVWFRGRRNKAIITTSWRGVKDGADGAEDGGPACIGDIGGKEVPGAHVMLSNF